MKRHLSIAVLALVLATGLSVSAETDAEVEARKTALEIAGAFANEGFKVRDGHWCGTVKPHSHALVAVNLYTGNQYWFSAGITDPAKKITVSVYDETGKQVVTDDYKAEEKAAAGFTPTTSGQYFISVDLVEGSEGSFCLVYSYK